MRANREEEDEREGQQIYLSYSNCLLRPNLLLLRFQDLPWLRHSRSRPMQLLLLPRQPHSQDLPLTTTHVWLLRRQVRLVGTRPLSALTGLLRCWIKHTPTEKRTRNVTRGCRPRRRAAGVAAAAGPRAERSAFDAMQGGGRRTLHARAAAAEPGGARGAAHDRSSLAGQLGSVCCAARARA